MRDPASKTRTKTVDDADPKETVDVTIFCDEVRVGEDPSVAGWPTTDWTLRQPDATSPAIQKSGGTTHIFRGRFSPGDVLAHLATVAGSTTFFIHEIHNEGKA